MFCTTCGKELSETDRFCPQCGTLTTKGATEQPHAETGLRRPLVRPMQEKVIAGVCAGVARNLNVDVTLVRILWLCFAVFAGAGFIAYAICWIVMPREDRPALAGPPPPQQPAGDTQSTPNT